jgi:hypothetical protein
MKNDSRGKGVHGNEDYPCFAHVRPGRVDPAGGAGGAGSVRGDLKKSRLGETNGPGVP